MSASNTAPLDETKQQELKNMNSRPISSRPISSRPISSTNNEIIKPTSLSSSSSDTKQPSDDSSTEVKPIERLFYTLSLLLSMLLIGFTSSLMGSTFVDMKVYLDCDTRMISLVMPSQTAGLMLGSSLCFLKLNRLSETLSIGLTCLAGSLMTVIAAAVRSIYWYLLANGLVGLSLSIALCDIQPYLLTLWDKHRLKEPIVHFQHSLWALGVAIGPLFIIPLLDKSLSPSVTGQETNLSMVSPESWNSVSAETFYNTSTSGNSFSTEAPVTREYTGLVQYAYVAMGLPLAVPSICLIIASLKINKSMLRLKESKSDVGLSAEVETSAGLSKQHTLVLYSLLALFIYFFVLVQLIPHSFLTLFVTTLLGWKVPENTVINTAYFGSLCAGRLVGIGVSAWVRQATLLNINLTSCLLAAILFLFSPRHDIVVWLAAGMLGFGLSTINAAIILWLNDQVRVTDRIVAVTMLSSGIGGMTGPLLVGQLFPLTPMWMVYVLVAAVSLQLLTYVAMRLVVAKCSRPNVVAQVTE